MKAPNVVAVLGGMLAGLVLGIGFNLGLRAEPESAAAPEAVSPLPAAALPSEVLQQLDRLERGVSALLERGAGGGESYRMEAPLGEAPASQPLKDIDEKLDALMELVRKGSGGIDPTSLSAAGRGYIPTNVGAVSRMLDEMGADMPGTLARHYYMTARLLYETYGAPGATQDYDGSTFWAYEDSGSRWVQFELRDGLVQRVMTDKP